MILIPTGIGGFVFVLTSAAIKLKMDLFQDSLGNLDLLENMAMLSWMQTGDSSMAQKILTARTGMELYQRLSGERDVDMLRSQTILAIANYVKQNPKAKKEDLQKVIAKHIFDFANKLNRI